jgi:uncharacterized protein DUF2585
VREGRGTAAWAWPAAVLLVLLGTASVLLWMGRVPICACGMVELWHGAVQSAENSQHLTDWYTPSHVVHGFLFYALLSPLAPRLSFGARAVVATAVEAAWEIVENTDAVIRHYREATISLDYFGDSVLNSSADILAMLLGFWLASRLPVPATVALALAMELFVGWMICDNLTLNVLMLLWPLESLRAWQAGA